ncbi:MAG TPA: sugar efflux transporter [Opitutaceae bacterium]|nr:sugar efflux transporter [Opitutaceae bacterium]
MHRLSESIRLVFRNRDFPGLLAANFALGMGYSFVVPFMSMWGTLKVQMSPVVFGTFMTITAISSVVLSTVLARWSDTHVTRRTMLILGSAGGMIGYVGYAYLTNPVALTIVGSLGLGLASVNLSQIFAHVREEFDRPENPSKAGDVPFLMSLVRVSFSLAWTVGPAIGAAVMHHFSYRGIFLGAASLFLVFLFGVLVFVPNRPHPPIVHTAAREPMLRVLTRGDILLSFAAFVIVFAAHSINLMNLPLLITEQLGGTEKEVGYVFVVAPFAEMPLIIWAGRAAARGHMMALLRIGAATTVIYFLCLLFVRASWHIYPMQILSAISIAILTNITIPFFQELLPGQAGLATSLFTNSFNAGNLLGYFVFGLVVDHVGHRGMFGVCSALAAFTTITLLIYRHRPPPSLSAGLPARAIGIAH